MTQSDDKNLNKEKLKQVTTQETHITNSFMQVNRRLDDR